MQTHVALVYKALLLPPNFSQHTIVTTVKPSFKHPPKTIDAKMKTFALTSIIALATVASAQLDKIPSCAVRDKQYLLSSNVPLTLAS